MRSKVLLLVLFIYSKSIIALSQINEQDILACSNLQEGIYATFDEFRTNSPSLRVNVEYVEPKISNKVNGHLYITDTSGKKTKYKGNLWGYSDGKKVFVINHDGAKHFCELITIDRYCYFIVEEYLWSKGPVGMQQTGKIEKEFILNINNGKTYRLNNDTMNEILANDRDLLTQYDLDKDKKNKLRFYIDEYCKRNKNQIKPISK